MTIWSQFWRWFGSAKARPTHLQRGDLGEVAARNHLCSQGMKFLIANFRHERGEIDLILRDGESLVFVEVKTRNPGGWTRPAAAVNSRKKRILSKTALAYLRQVRLPAVTFRFDVVEVLMEGDVVCEIRHLPNQFPLDRRYRYG
jgi:putative endonuclease